MSNSRQKQVIIFGASSEVGQCISDILSNDYTVVGLTREAFKSASSSSDYDTDMSLVFQKLNLQLEKYDIFIFNQAYTCLAAVENLSFQEISKSFLVNSVFPLQIINYVLNHSVGFHRFIFITSIAGSFRSVSASVAYSSSKRSIHGIIKHLSIEKAGQADFVGIAPSQIDSRSLRQNLSPERIKQIKKDNPTGKLCSPLEVAFMVKSVADYPGRHINGSIIDLNGGIF